MFVVLAQVSCVHAQRQVESAAYNTMLKTLLSHSVPEISADSLSLVTDDVILLDAREQAEYDVSHLEDAFYFGYYHYDSTAVSGIYKDAPIVVYCSIGYRSEKIAERLQSAGYSNVSNLYGGIFEWVNQDGQVVDKTGDTEKVHAFSLSWGIWLNEGEKVYNKDLK